jgi:Holliday junction DNA helicase RuvA
MIASLRGSVLAKSPTEVVLDVQGVGYAVSIPLSTYERVGELRSELFLYTHHHVRDDAIQLYGFATEEERAMFRLLLSVSGIGPKMALGMLSGMPARELQAHIASGNLGALTAVPGIGKKLAERLLLELREKFAKGGEPPFVLSGASGEDREVRQEALLALLSLGFARPAAEAALRRALAQPRATEASLEELIKLALRQAGR